MSDAETGLAFITEFVRDKCPDAGYVGVDDDLLDSGILQSLHFVELLYLIEERLGTELSMDEVSTEDFRTIARISERFLA
jgi:acyl carrier protein